MFGVTFERWEVEVVGALLLAAFACLGVGFWLHSHDAGVARAATAPILAAADAASAAQAAKKATTDAEQAANLHEANAQNAARAVDAHDLAAAVADAGRLRDDALHRSAAVQAARPAGGGDSGIRADPDMVPWPVYVGALDARAAAESDAAGLAIAVDALATSGQLCVGDYRSAQ